MFLSRSRRIVSTHIQGLGNALFHLKEKQPALYSFSPDGVNVDSKWVTKTGLIVEGLAQQDYLHLDIRTPFGETVEQEQVDNAFAESLGPRRDKYKIGHWHIQFVEDTNLGSNHRIFVDLIATQPRIQPLSGMDMALPLEQAMEALGELAMHESGLANFQLLYGGPEFCYSLLFLNGSVFHLLKVNEPVGLKVASRLKQHREFLLSQNKLAGNALKTLLLSGDALGDCDIIQELNPQRLQFGLSWDQEKGQASEDRLKHCGILLHLGLAYATLQKDYNRHNRIGQDEQAINYSIRERHRFLGIMSGSLALATLIILAYGIALFAGKKQLLQLRQAAAKYQVQVNSINGLRREKIKLEMALEELRPVWSSPVNWSRIYTGLSAALPEESGIDGLSVGKTPDGTMELSFRVWVRDWGQVQGIQKKLQATAPFISVSLSEQRKDLSSGVVIFNVTCQLERL